MSTPRSGRRIVYPNQIALETDVLYTNMYKMVDVSMLAQALIGNGFSLADCVAGLACTPVGPTSFSVNIAPGTYYSYQELDATNYSSIPSDTADMLYKQYVNLSTYVQGGFAAPGSGNNYYLLQAIWQTTDTNPVNSAYYNSSDPNVPQFITENTTRLDNIVFSTKVSTSSTPTPDANHVGLYAITIPSGASGINSGMISIYPGAPFINASIFNSVSYNQLQQSSPIFAVDSSVSANTITVTPSPAYSALVDGSRIYVKVANTNTGATSMNVSALGSVSVYKLSSTGITALVGYELIANYIYEFIYDGTHWLIVGQVKPNIVAQLSMNAPQTINAGTSNTLVNFNDNSVNGFDPWGITNTTNKSITAPVAGYYRLSVSINFTQCPMTVDYYVGGVGQKRFIDLANIPATSGNQSGYASRIVFFNAGSVVTIEAANPGATNSILGDNSTDQSNCWFELEYLGN